MGAGGFSGFDSNKQVGSAVSPCTTGPSSQASTATSTAHWIEINLVAEDGSPCPDIKYRIEAPDGSVIEGSLNAVGFARVSLPQSGNCKITFPELDTDMWKRM
jgi:hypothetical protein